MIKQITDLESSTQIELNPDCQFIMDTSSKTTKRVSFGILKQKITEGITPLKLSDVYPIGSIFTTISDSETCQFENIDGMHWEKIASGKCLFGATASQTPGNTINQGLPKPSVSTSSLSCSENGAHTHTVSSPGSENAGDGIVSRCTPYSSITKTTSSNGSHTHTISGNVTITDDDTYKTDNTVVQPPAIAVIFWKRVS